MRTIAIGVLTAGVAWAAASSCEKLASLKLPNVAITLAQIVPAGEFKPPPSEGPAPPRELVSRLPAFCRIAATLTPSSDSDIKIEVWMPVDGWNGKLQGVGNGGWSGAISYPGLAGGVVRGYATASTDTGHSGGSGHFVLGHPEKLIDFGYRAVHERSWPGRSCRRL